jgi:hypothetical protein
MALGGLKIAWLGSATGECAQLLERIRQDSSVHTRHIHIDIHRLEQWDSAATRDADRIVLVAKTRLDYPWQTIAQLQTSQSHIPWGVVTGVWHAGSRRTGIGSVTHWQLPWYRWWDGWRGWFFPEFVRSGSQCPTQFEPITLPIDLATPSAREWSARPPSNGSLPGEVRSAVKSLLIVSACQETAATWRLSAERAGWSSTVAHPRDLAVVLEDAGRRDPSALLWDDTCHDRLPGNAPFGQSCVQCQMLARRFPGVPIVAALAIGHIAAWPQLKAAGVSDFFIKPSHALPLTDYLVSTCSQVIRV